MKQADLTRDDVTALRYYLDEGGVHVIVVDATVEEARAFDAEGYPALIEAFDLAQAAVFMDEADTSYLIVRIA